MKNYRSEFCFLLLLCSLSFSSPSPDPTPSSFLGISLPHGSITFFGSTFGPRVDTKRNDWKPVISPKPSFYPQPFQKPQPQNHYQQPHPHPQHGPPQHQYPPFQSQINSQHRFQSLNSPVFQQQQQQQQQQQHQTQPSYSQLSYFPQQRNSPYGRSEEVSSPGQNTNFPSDAYNSFIVSSPAPPPYVQSTTPSAVHLVYVQDSSDTSDTRLYRDLSSTRPDKSLIQTLPPPSIDNIIELENHSEVNSTPQPEASSEAPALNEYKPFTSFHFNFSTPFTLSANQANHIFLVLLKVLLFVGNVKNIETIFSSIL